VAGFLAASASAAPIYTKQDCFNVGGVNGCAASPQLGVAIAAVPSPDGRNVYGVAVGGGITLFNRTASNGALARVPGCYQATNANGCTAYQSINQPFDVAFDAAGTSAYVLGNSGFLGVLARDTGTGALTSQKQCITDTAPVLPCVNLGVGTSFLYGARSIVVAPGEGNVYVGSNGRGTNGDRDGVTRFHRNGDGTLTLQGCTTATSASGCAGTFGPLVGGTGQMAMPLDGRFLYTTGLNDDAVVVFQRNTSTGLLSSPGCYSSSDAACTAIAAVTASPFVLLIPPDDQGKLYVGSANGVAVFSRSTTTGAIGALLGCVNAGGVGGCGRAPGLGLGVPTSMALSADGTDLAVVGSAVNSGVVFLKRDKATGLLSEPEGGAGCITHDGTAGKCRTDPALGGQSIVHAAPGAAQFYLGSVGTSSIAGFRVDNPPVCAGAAIATAFQTAVAAPLSCTDPDGDPVSIRAVAAPGHGGLGAIDQAARAVSYNPLAGFSGADSFTFAADAHGLTSNVATDTVTVGAAPPPPTPRIASAIKTEWLSGSTTKVVRLTVENVPKGATVKVKCKGAKHAKHKGGCPFASKTYREPNGKSALALKSRFRHAKLQPGTVITIDITAPGSIGKEVRYTIRKRHLPKSKTYCLPVGSTHPHTHC
jgi:hypothetical protein